MQLYLWGPFLYSQDLFKNIYILPITDTDHVANICLFEAKQDLKCQSLSFQADRWHQKRDMAPPLLEKVCHTVKFKNITPKSLIYISTTDCCVNILNLKY